MTKSQTMKINLVFLLALTVSALFYSSCQKLENLDKLEASGIDAEYAIPLFSTDFNMGEVLDNFDENSSVFFDENGQAILRYFGDFTSSGSEDIFAVLSVINNIPIPLVDTVSALPFVAPDGVTLDYALLKTGGFRYFFSLLKTERFFLIPFLPLLM